MQEQNPVTVKGTEVYWTKTKQMADVVDYSAGWVTIRTDDGEEHKVRAKELVVIGDNEEAEEALGTHTEEDVVDPSPASSDDDSGEEDEVFCPKCGEAVRTALSENIRCHKCGWTWRVRLHPDKERYFTGLGTTPSGRDTVDINDYVAEQLRELTAEQAIHKVCNAILDSGYTPKQVLSKTLAKKHADSGLELCDFFQERYADRNNGMVRMNMGNIWRGALKRIEILNNTPKNHE